MSWFVTMCFLMACHYSYGQSSETTWSLRSGAIVRQPSNQRVANEHRSTLLDYANPAEKENGMPRAHVKSNTPLSSDAKLIMVSKPKGLEQEREKSKNEIISKNDYPLQSRIRRSEELLRENRGEKKSPENRQDRLDHLGNFYPRYEPHQQSTNMRPTRSYFLELYDKDFFRTKRHRETEKNFQNSIRNYNARYAVPRDGIQRDLKIASIQNSHPRNLRNLNGSKRTVGNSQSFENDRKRNSKSVSVSLDNNAFRPNPEISKLDQTTSARLFRLNPAHINPLQGVFDNSKIFDENLIKQYSLAEPRIIIQNSKDPPANYADSNSETRTVQELVNLIGQNPQQQLQGLNVLLGADQQILANARPRDIIPVSEVPVSYEQTFVTPLPEENPKSPPEIYPESILENSKFKNHEIDYRPIEHTKVQKKVVNFENHHTVPAVWIESELPDGEVYFEKSKKNKKNHNQSSEKDYTQYASKYSFGYHVTDPETGNDFGHHEEREGDVTIGKYHVLLPDGRIQSVSYHVDDKGYHAQVSYRPNQGH